MARSENHEPRLEMQLPDVGEGLTEAEVVEWHVGIGDVVAMDQIVVDIETAKSIVSLPSPCAGTIRALRAAVGVSVQVGATLVEFDPAPLMARQAGAGAASAGPNEAQAESLVPERVPVLVGYGAGTAKGRCYHLTPRSNLTRERQVVVRPTFGEPGPAPHALATPPVRALAKRLGVDLLALAAREPEAVVTREMVVGAADVRPPQHGPREVEAPAEQDQLVPVRGVRKATAAAMVRSAFSAPHVTEWLSVDVTETMRLLTRLRQEPALAHTRVTVLLLVAKAFLFAIRRSPDINASWDEDGENIRLKERVNLGVAVASERGLLVPNIKAADLMTLPQLAAALDAVITSARAGRSSSSDLAGGTVTITNLGALGVDGGTPILNPGEAAILAVGAIRQRPWVLDGEVVVRDVLTMALSFDHRLVDGVLGSRVLVDLGNVLENPGLALLS